MLGGFIVCVQLDEGKRNSVSYVLVGFDNVFILLIFLSACGINNPIDISVSRIPLIFFSCDIFQFFGHGPQQLTATIILVSLYSKYQSSPLAPC